MFSFAFAHPVRSPVSERFKGRRELENSPCELGAKSAVSIVAHDVPFAHGPCTPRGVRGRGATLEGVVSSEPGASPGAEAARAGCRMEGGHDVDVEEQDMDLERIAVLLRPEDEDLPVQYCCRKCATANNATPTFSGVVEWATWRCTNCDQLVHICRYCPNISVYNACKKVHVHVRGKKQQARQRESHGSTLGHRFFKTARYTCSTDDPGLRKRLLDELEKCGKELRRSIATRFAYDSTHKMLEERMDAEWKKCCNFVDLVGSVSDVLPPSSSSNAGDAEGAGAVAGAGRAAGAAGGAGGAGVEGATGNTTASLQEDEV